MRLFRHAFKKTSQLIKARIADISRPLESELKPVLVRAAPRHPIHPVARLLQSQGRWYTTHSAINATVRRFLSTGSAPATKYNRANFPRSATATAVSRLTIRTPFASTLRPNLTGGALPRTAGGYGMGGSARYFSHGPTAPAQVVHNVSTAVRAFLLSGQKAQFDGVTAAGEKRFRCITTLQEETGRKLQSISKHALGSFIDFDINPTITALSPLGAVFPYGGAVENSLPTLNTEGMLDVLSVDFARVLRDLATTMNDLKRLSALGDLPITLEQKSILRVHFPGSDMEMVERICDEIGVQRGVIHEDAEFCTSVGGHMGLMFPFASTQSEVSSPAGSLRSVDGHEYERLEEMEEHEEIPWPFSPEGYETLDEISESGSEYFAKAVPPHSSLEYEGLEGIHRFLELCDTNFRRV